MTGQRVQFPPSAAASEILTPEFVEFLGRLDAEFRSRIDAVRDARAKRIHRAVKQRVLPTSLPPSEATSEPWQVPELPEPLRAPGIEISGPASIPSMMIQALNPGPEGERAVGYLDDDEDSGGHSFDDTIQAAQNRKE